nr:uncharacterized protein LOC111516767 [Leptinotarsa decemlineata]
MLSGIGPKQHLEQFGIPVIQDLPVGAQLYDHATFPGMVFRLNESIGINILRKTITPSTYLQYFKESTGMLTTLGGIEAVTFMRTNISSEPDPSYPDMEFLFASISANSDYGLAFRKIVNISPAIYDKIWKPLEGEPVFQVR